MFDFSAKIYIELIYFNIEKQTRENILVIFRGIIKTVTAFICKQRNLPLP